MIKLFLDNVCNKTIELELGKMYEYKGHYTQKYLILKEEDRRKQLQLLKPKDQIKQIERKHRTL